MPWIGQGLYAIPVDIIGSIIMLTDDQKHQIEQNHNTFIDRATMQHNRQPVCPPEVEPVYGWEPIPQEWIDEVS